MDEVVQSRLFGAPWIDPAFRRLPGMMPDAPDGWAFLDDGYAGQMALRDRLILDRRDAVIALEPGAQAAADELLAAVLERLPALGGFRREDGAVTRPDGVAVGIDRADPLGTVGRLLQEDFCLIARADPGHRLAGAVLCFPAGWTLSEKLGRSLGPVHRNVPVYGAQATRRVDRLFDALRPGRPLWRANLHFQKDAALYTPLREADPKPGDGPGSVFVRTERQVIFRLPKTGCAVFSIHTQIVRVADLRPEEVAALADWKGQPERS